MELRIFGVTFRLFWSFDVDSVSQAQTALPPIPIPFLVARNGTADALAILREHPIAALKAAYGQSLTIARQMLRDGMHHQDAPGFAALCLGLDILGAKLPIAGIPKDHHGALLPSMQSRQCLPDEGNTDPILPPKPKKKDRGNDHD